MSDTIDLSTQPFDKVVELANEWRSLAKQERERANDLQRQLDELRASTWHETR